MKDFDRQKDRQRLETKVWTRLVEKHPCHVKACPWGQRSVQLRRAPKENRDECAASCSRCKAETRFSSVNWIKVKESENLNQNADGRYFCHNHNYGIHSSFQ